MWQGLVYKALAPLAVFFEIRAGRTNGACRIDVDRSGATFSSRTLYNNSVTGWSCRWGSRESLNFVVGGAPALCITSVPAPVACSFQWALCVTPMKSTHIGIARKVLDIVVADA